jgi:MFS family permease
MLPAVGALSDRTPGRLGRRRPYIILGTLLMLISMVAAGAATTLFVFVVGILAIQVAGNISGAAYQGLLPDRVPLEQRGVASGYLGLMTILGNVGSLAMAALLLGDVSAGSTRGPMIRQGAALYYALTGVVLVLGAIVTLLGVREVPFEHLPAREAPPAMSRRQRLAQLWIEPWRSRNFLWVFLTRSFVILGLTLFLTFIEYYFASVAHIDNFARATASLAVLALLGAVASALVLGILSDRTRRVPIVCVSTALMTLAALTFVVAPDSVPLWPLGILFGLGYGAYTSVDWALAIDVLPSMSAAGKDLGLWSIASTLPAILAPLLGALVIGLAAVLGQTALGYRAVFGLAVLFFLLGTVFVLKVREARAGDEQSVPGEAYGM